MFIRDIFDTKIEETIEPVIRVAERQDENKLAAEIGSYVVTPTIEKYLDDFLEHYTDTFRAQTTEIGVWISGYFGSGKSHLAKIAALLAENRVLAGISAAKRFEARVPTGAPSYASIVRHLGSLHQCDSRVLAFNINTISDSRNTPLPKLLLSQYYQSKGYGSNLFYARVIEAELDKRGKLDELHAVAQRLAKKTWDEIQRNPTFYAKALYQAACEVAPDAFTSPDQVQRAITEAGQGEQYNVQFLVRTLLEEIEVRQKTSGTPCRLIFVLDESGQWIEDSQERLSALQALVEEAADKGQGKIWIFVTTHEDMGAIYQNARAIRGDMKKIEGRFRFKFNLTTENIELVLEDRIFKKNAAGAADVRRIYNDNPGVLRDLGQLSKVDQQLPECSEERFQTFYPFFPFQIHLVPEIIKSLRSAGGRGEQLSGSTRTLLAVTQDILRSGRRKYLDQPVGDVVSFDEVYNNLAFGGEVSPDVRRELSRIEDVVPGATALTRRAAEVLLLIREIAYVPRSLDNIARLLVEHTTDDLASVRSRVEPELQKLIKARLVAKIGEEYEFLTGERRTFEDEVAQTAAELKRQDLDAGLAKLVAADSLGFSSVAYKGTEFPVRILFDGSPVSRDGRIQVRISSPLALTKLSDLEESSSLPDEQQTLFVLCDRVPHFDEQLKYCLAMRAVIDRWKGDTHKSADARNLAVDRESVDLQKLRGKIAESITEGLKRSHIIFRGSARAVAPKATQTAAECLRTELAAFWPTLYPKFDKVPVRIVNEQRAILDVLKGARDLTTDVRDLRLLDKAGQLDPTSPLLDSLRIYLAGRQSRKERTLGHDAINEFTSPPYGWDPGAVRVGVAALLRAGALKVLLNKKPFTNPADPELQDALRVSRTFDKVELVLEEMDMAPDLLTETRALIIKLTGRRKIDETPAAIAAEMGALATDLLTSADKVALWAEPAGLPLSSDFTEGRESLQKIISLINPVHRVNEIAVCKDRLEPCTSAIRAHAAFVEKSGKSFSELRAVASLLRGLEYRLDSKGKCVGFLTQWGDANAAATVVTPEVWKTLVNAKALADHELLSLQIQWKADARAIADKALAELPGRLAAADLHTVECQESLATPLNGFRATLDAEADPTRIAVLPDRATRLVSELAAAIAREVAARTPNPEPPKPGTDPKPEKPVKRVRVAEVVKAVRIENEDQWNAIRDRLDQTIRRELSSGNSVELS
jgi:hypothetical protein